jgi:hypothetical protein
MSDLDALYDELAFEIGQLSSREPKPLKGNLGGINENGVYEVEVDENHVRLHFEHGISDTALNLGVPIIPEYPVLYHRSGDTAWVTPDPERIPRFVGNQNFPANSVGKHTHEPGFGNFDFVSAIRIKYGLVIHVSDLKVKLLPRFYFNRVTQQFTWFPGVDEVDLTPALPSSSGEINWGIAGIDHNANGGAVQSTEASLALDWSISDLTGLDVDAFEPLMAFRLAYGKTTLAFSDFEYCQMWGAPGVATGEATASNIVTSRSGQVVISRSGLVVMSRG